MSSKNDNCFCFIHKNLLLIINTQKDPDSVNGDVHAFTDKLKNTIKDYIPFIHSYK